MFNTVKAFFIQNKTEQTATTTEAKTEAPLPKKTVKDLKEELKKLAVEIRELKSHRPLSNRSDWSLWCLDAEIRSKSRETRHKHIAYCLIRGRTYEQIEQKCREDNNPDFKLVDKITKEYTDAA